MMETILRPYPEYRATDLPWAGALPAHWKTRRAKWLFTREERPIRPEDEPVTCFRDGVVTLRRNRRTTGFTESIKEIGYQGIRKGDLVIHAMDAFAGAVGVSDSDGKGTPVYAVCKPKEDADAEYYARVIREMARSQYIAALAKGIRQRSTDFRYATFADQLLPLPPSDEQEAISRFLIRFERKGNRLIRAKQRLIALLNEQKQAIIRRAVTRGIDPDGPLKPSGVEWLGDVPAHWSVWKIGHFARVGNGSTPSRGNNSYWTESGYPWLNSSAVNEGRIVAAKQFVTEHALAECHLPRVKPGSILVAITGQGKTRGTAAVLATEATINQHVAFITITKALVDTEYLFTALTAAYQPLRSLSDGTGSTKGALTCGDIKHFKIPVPPPEEQRSTVQFVRDRVSQLDATIASTQREVDLIREYRTRLIADIVTGKLDVRGVAVPEVDDAETSTDLDLSEGDESILDEEALADAIR